jgi:hypothetical protein
LDSFGGFFDYVIEYDDERKSVYIYIGGVWRW